MAKGTLVADVVAADTVAGVPPCIMGTFLEGKSCKHKLTEEQCSHTHTRQRRRGRRTSCVTLHTLQDIKTLT